MHDFNPHYNATVISHYGHELLIQTREGERLRAVPRQHLPALASGDRIMYEAGSTGEIVITELAPRHGILARASKNQDKLIAVNIDQVLIVSAAKPALKTGLIDRYLVACELAELSATIVFNKTDLLDDEHLQEVKTALAIYESIGYPVHFVSARTKNGIPTLLSALQHSTSVLVGHSAVGKSSLIKAMLPATNPRIGEVSKATNKGRHTTTHTELYTLDSDSYIIDSPGIREFGLKKITAQELALGFREFRPYSELCKFRDCTHTREPGCAVKQAVADNRISQSRMESYLAILESFSGM